MHIRTGLVGFFSVAILLMAPEVFAETGVFDSGADMGVACTCNDQCGTFGYSYCSHGFCSGQGPGTPCEAGVGDGAQDASPIPDFGSYDFTRMEMLAEDTSPAREQAREQAVSSHDMRIGGSEPTNEKYDSDSGCSVAPGTSGAPVAIIMLLLLAVFRRRG